METEEIQDVEMTEEQAANAIAGLLDQQQPAGAEEASPDGEVHPEPTEEVEAAAEEARREAEQQLANQTGDFDYGRASAQLAEAAAQLATLRKMRNRAGRG